MRYQVGEKLIVVSFQYQGRDLANRFMMPYLHENMIEKIWIKELEVKEHHKVSWEYDIEDKKECDGYILAGTDETVWYNQYPKASYGQVTAESDLRFQLNTKEHDINSLTVPFEFRLIQEVYGDVIGVIQSYSHTADKTYSQDRIQKLIQLKIDLENQLANEFKKKFVCKPVHEDHPDIDVWTLEDIPKGRYQVGEKLITVFFEIEGRKLSDWFIMPYLYDMHKVEKVWLKELEVKEHHKVHWSEDPTGEKKYDGYILLDDGGNTFHNQYPSASMEQLSCEGDALFERNFPDGKDEIESYFNDPKEPIDFKLLTEVYRQITRGLSDLHNGLARPESDDRDRTEFRQKIELLTPVKEDIDKQLAETFKKKFDSKPLYEGSKNLKWFLIDL